jgi:peptide/nickel transport system substrate-binding protein
MQWKKPISVAGASLLLSLAACGGGSDTDNSDSSTAGGGFTEGGNAGAGQNPELQPPAAEVEGATEGGTVTVLSQFGLTTMDPAEAYYVNTGSILSHLVTRSLTQYRFVDGDMELVPDIATDLGTPNEDFTEWKFTIRPGVRYEDGAEVTCEDFVYGIKRSMDRKQFPGGAGYSNDYFAGGDTYGGAYSDPKGKFEAATCDGDELTINMASPFPDMPYWGAFPAISPVPEGKADDPAEYALHPLSTGPYMFDKYKPGKTLTLVQNPEWDPETDTARHQYVDGYDMNFDTQSKIIDQTIISDNGEGQTTLTYDNVLQSDRQAAEETGRMIVGSQPCTFLWYPDYKEINDINVRKALGYAYPYADAWVAGGEIVGLTRVPGTNYIPPGTPGRDEEYDILGNKGMEPDTAKAKQMLTDADALGTEIKFLYVANDPASVAAKDQVVRSLEEAGFKASPVAAADSTEAAELRADFTNDLTLRSGGWCSDWPSGASWIPPLFQKGSGANYAQFFEPAVEKEIARIQTLPIEEQPEAWNALDKTIAEKYYPAINIGYGGVAMLHGSAVMKMENDSVFGMPVWKDIYLQQ